MPRSPSQPLKPRLLHNRTLRLYGGPIRLFVAINHQEIDAPNLRGGVGAHRCVQGKGAAALGTSAAARDAALGAVKPPMLWRGWDTRLDAAKTAGCRRAAWVAGCGHQGSRRRGGRGRGVSERGCRSASVRPGKGCGSGHVCCSPRCRLGSGKTPEAAEGASSGGKGWTFGC